ncbi:MAG: hypothetical protein BVN34_01385 [Proteobacteria bacterium ST_bin12]|nr:MAG: hypothetical protein BVN34_01385 [Proteobacteria bacterium ST_bin12]
MNAFFSTLSCCWFWLLLGFLLGWLLNRWLCKCCCPNHSKTDTTPTSAPANTSSTSAASTNETSKLAEMPAPKVAVSKAASPAAKPAKTAAAKPAPTKSATPSASVMIDIAAAKAAGFALKNANDLTVIEGIGPKINELFHNNGIKTFAALAEATVPQMRAILDAGGSRFRIANPSTWAQQAALAAENKWTELKKLQNALSGGVKK